MKGRKTGRGREKGLTFLLIFISSPLEFLAKESKNYFKTLRCSNLRIYDLINPENRIEKE